MVFVQTLLYVISEKKNQTKITITVNDSNEQMIEKSSNRNEHSVEQ